MLYLEDKDIVNEDSPLTYNVGGDFSLKDEKKMSEVLFYIQIDHWFN